MQEEKNVYWKFNDTKLLTQDFYMLSISCTVTQKEQDVIFSANNTVYEKGNG